MYYQSYEDYMRNVLGYPTEEAMCPMSDMYCKEAYIMNMSNNQELEEMYPEIYRLIYPMVCRACDMNQNRPITEEMLEQMTNDIYSNIEVDMNIENRTDNKNSNTKPTSERENRQRPINRTLRDLIRILILRELLGRPPIRPPFPPRPPRPPFPGPGPRPPRPPRPPFPGPGPIMPRDFEGLV